jgi:hypothetical protein
MASGSLTFTADFGSNGLLRALGFTAALFLLPSAMSGSQAAQSTAALPPNAPAIPTTIRNAPFSAAVSTQYDRVLANGNHIHRETRGEVFRDAQGRVRTETQIQSSGAGGTCEHIAIQDPILREVIHLDARTRTANVHHLADVLPSSVSAGIAGGSNKQGSVVITAPQASPTEGSIVIPLHSDVIKPPTIELLGTKVMEGVQVVGTRTTRMIADGDNEPIVAVTEVWYSRELQMVILSVADDGQSGRSLMRVTNIVRSPPNEQLFQVPPDYTVKDGSPVAAIIKH